MQPHTKIKAATGCLFLLLQYAVQAQLTNGLVAYWPLATSAGCNNQTPELVHGYTMDVLVGGNSASGLSLGSFDTNIYITNMLGRTGIYVNNTGAEQSSMAFQSLNTNDVAPVLRYSPTSNTISFWINCAAGKPPANNDQRMVCESDFIRTLASVWDLSAVGNGYDCFLRQNGPSGPYGNFSGGTHIQAGGTTTGPGGNTIADGTWHNVTWEANGTNYLVFVDGVLDPTFVPATPAQFNPQIPTGLWKLDTVGLFALIRNGSAGFITQAAVSGLAEWARPLSTNEITNYMAGGIPGLVAVPTPLAISQFSSDLYSVNQGSNAVLTWQANSDATDISINNGVGDVFSISSCGGGNKTIAVNGNTTYTITATRGTNTVSKSLTITTVSGVAPGWNYLAGFNDLPVNTALGNQGNWESLTSSPETATYSFAEVLNTVPGNHVLGMNGEPILSAAILGHLGQAQGGSNTLFFRFYIDGSINNVLSTNSTNAAFDYIPDCDVGVGLSDETLFDVVSFTGTNKGPAIRIIRDTSQSFIPGSGGPIDLTANWGADNDTGFSWIASVDPNGLKTNTVYNVWLDMYNGPYSNNIANEYSVTVQVGGDSGTLTNLFTLQPSDSETNHATRTQAEAFIAVNKVQTFQSTNAILMDDFYLSSGGGFNHTIPAPQSSFVLSTIIPITSVSASGGSVTLNWTPTPAGTNTFSVQRETSLTGSSWSTIATGLSASTYTDTGAPKPTAYYRVTSP
ncbi:MAG TPA: hypothetical protein VN048_06920 [Verrucomicrobiae bacterium]|jgi:hypothetical protein|nr:hypothetical protein [Verrucomicrobiae bacterium]